MSDDSPLKDFVEACCDRLDWCFWHHL